MDSVTSARQLYQMVQGTLRVFPDSVNPEAFISQLQTVKSVEKVLTGTDERRLKAMAQQQRKALEAEKKQAKKSGGSKAAKKVAAAAAPAPARASEEDRLAAFTTWLPGVGVECAALRFERIASLGCNGAVCARALAESDEAFCVPRGAMLCAEDVLQDGWEGDFGRVLREDALFAGNPSAALALYLLVEKSKGAESRFAPYLDILPSEFPGLPIVWEEADLALLSSVEAGSMACKRRRDFVTYYTHLCMLDEATSGTVIAKKLGALFSWEAFLWAMCVVVTRQNPLPLRGDPDRQSFALIPVFDMCNHEDGKYSSGFSVEKQALQCFAKRAFAEGDEFRIFYGPRGNTELLVYCGFTVPANPHTGASPKGWVELVEDELYKLKENLLAKAGHKSFGFVQLTAQDVASNNVGAEADPAAASTLAQFARIRAATKEDLLTCMRAQQADSADGGIPRLSDDNEALARQYIGTVVAAELQHRQATVKDITSSDKQDGNRGLVLTLLQDEIRMLEGMLQGELD